MEFLYKLALPPLEDVITSEFRQYIECSFNTSEDLFKQISPAEFAAGVIHDTYKKINNVTFNYGIFFMKNNGYTQRIHYDDMGDKFCWGINFIGYGDGYYNYYDETHLGAPSLYENGTAIKFDEAVDLGAKPIKTYYTPPGAYLVNARQPHSAIGYNNRAALSIRNTAYFVGYEWENIVKHFSNLIIT